jgi:RND family efflux transporter MFP subunit
VSDEAQPLRSDTAADAYSPSASVTPLDASYGTGLHTDASFVAGTASDVTADSPSGAFPAATAPGTARPIWKKRRFQLGVALALLIAIGVVMGIRASRPSAGAETGPTLPLVSVTVPGTSAVTSRVAFTGAISARFDMPIGVEDGGSIAAVLVEAGDRVRAGQLLARLDTSVAASQVASLKAQLEQAKAESTLAQQELKRAEQIVSSVAALSQSEVDRRRSEVATRAARVQAAQAQLAEVQARLGRTEIRAPADGVVLTRNAEVGQTATPGGAPLFRLGRGGEIEMRGQVSEQDLPKLALGMPANVRVTGVEKPFEGKVRLLGAVIDPQTRLGEIRIALKSDPNLRPGAFARGEVETGRATHPVLPQTAVLSDGTTNYVLVVGAGNKVERRVVTVAGTNDKGIVIASGLNGSERVVTTAGPFLREGEIVRTPGDAAAKPAAASKQG